MPSELTSRERMLRAIRRQDVDYPPCAFMSFTAMRGRVQDAYELAERELEMGMDSWLFVPTTWRGQRVLHPDLRGLPVRLPEEVRTDLWIERLEGEDFPVLHKVYHTPVGDLSVSVRKTEDWTHGNTVPFIDDFQIPRAIKPLITTREDLEVLRWILRPPTAEDIAAFRADMAKAQNFAARHGVMIAGGWGVSVDMAAWLFGLQTLVYKTMDDPDFVMKLLDIISAWNEQRMRVVLEAGVELFIRRAWYESAQFWSPKGYRKFLLPRVQREVQLAHEYGVPYGYTLTTGMLPMLDNIRETGIDVLIGLDPMQQGADPLATTRDKLSDKVCLWGGVNGAITVEEGTEEEVREAVKQALDVMRGVNGFILSPVDNITESTLNAWHNVGVFIDAWKKYR
jgi:uroporphyrinogen-III decarboxylase